MIDLKEFSECIWHECRAKFKHHGFNESSEIPESLDLISAGVLDSFDLLNIAIAIEVHHGMSMDFSVFSEGFDASLPGLYSSVSSGDNSAMEPLGLSLQDKVDRIAEELQQAEITNKDIILVHSSTATMGLEGEDACDKLYAALRRVIGDGGTILAPASNTSAFLDDTFDVWNTPVQPDLGLFSEYLRNRPGSERSQNPFDSVTGNGPAATEICSGVEFNCYGPQSPWHRLLGRNVKLVLLGVDFYIASIVHAAELDCQVSYRNWKKFKGTIIDGGAKSDVTINLYVSELGMKRYYQRIVDLASLRNSIQKLDINGGGFVAPLDDVYNSCCEALMSNSNVFVDPNAAT